MRAFLRGFGWFIVSLVVAALILHATVLDLWTVPEGLSGDPALAKGDRVLVLRESRASPGQLARCPDPKVAQAHFAVRLSPPAEGVLPLDDPPRAAWLAAPGKVPQRPGRRARGGREPQARLLPGEASPPASARADSAPPTPAPSAGCRRVVFRLWGAEGPWNPSRRLAFLE